ncbi:MAG: glycosyltransferase [Anaerolineae bacterium]
MRNLRVGVLIPGFSSDAHDWAIPVQLNLAREQARYVDYRVIALRYPHRRDHYQVFGAQVYSLGYGADARGMRRLLLWRETLSLLERLHREKPFDVLHAMWADETGLIAGWFGRRHRIPVVVSILGGELANLPRIDYGGQLSFYGQWVTGQALRMATRIQLVSGSVERMLAASQYARYTDKGVRIPLGVDAELFSPAEPDDYDPHRMICVASLIPVKAQESLFIIMSKMRSPVTLDLIGTGGERDRLEGLAYRMGIRVNFVGHVPHEELPHYYQRAALHMLTSKHETFALSVAEAAACGVPSIMIGDVGMLPDYPSIGMVLQAGLTSTQKAQLIEGLLTDKLRLDVMRRAARSTVEQELTLQLTAARLRDLYADLQTF